MGAPDSQRLQLLATQLIRQLREKQLAPRVVDAMARIPRHDFVPVGLLDSAYDDVSLPIGHGQTLTQPSLVALMTDRLRLTQSDVVLQVGLGSGYHAAILARLATRVHVVEIVPPLAVAAQMRLHKLGLRNVEVKIGDGLRGWKDRAPFHAICVTAAVPEVPFALLNQLAVGGRMVIPVGEELRVILKKGEHDVETVVVGNVAVPPVAGGA